MGVADERGAVAQQRVRARARAGRSRVRGRRRRRRPRSAAISAVMSEPDRSGASTTTVSRGEPGDDPVARGERPLHEPRARRQLGHDAAVGRDPPVERALAGGVGPVGAAGEHRDRGPGASSAPACAAQSMPSAMPLTTVIPAAASPRPNSAATSSPYGVARRAPTTATAGATPWSVRRSASRPGSPATCRTAGASARSSSGAGYHEPCRQTAPSPAAAIASQALSASNASRARWTPLSLRAPSAATRSSSSSASSSERRPPAPGALDARGDETEQVRAPQAGDADVKRQHAGPPCARGRAICAARAPRARAGPRSRSRPSRSATVRATRSTRSCPRALSVPSAYASRSGLAGAEGQVGRARRHGLRHLRVAARPRAGQPRRLALPGGEDLLADGRRGREGRRGQHLLVGTLHVDEEVDAVEQRAAEPPAVAGVVRSGAPARLVPAPARARVRGGDEHEAGREQRRALPAHDRHLPVLERLAQRLQRRPRELRQLVEEQDAVVGEARLPRAGMRPAARRGRTRRSCGAARGTAARR